MFVNKILNGLDKPSFKGYDHEKTKFGTDVLRFNFPHDNTFNECYVELYRPIVDDMVMYGHKVVDHNPVAKIKIEPNGTVINPNKYNFRKGEPIAYKLNINGNRFPDSGLKIDGDYNLITRTGPIPTIRGTGGLTMPDIQRPGARFAGYDAEDPQKIIYDEERQKNSEKIIRSTTNRAGGNLAGLIHDSEEFDDLGIKVLFATPIMGADDKSHHHYWNKNNFQLADEMGSLANFRKFLIDDFKKGRVYVDDLTITSEGLEGSRLQYAIKYGEKDPQAFYLFNIEALKNQPLRFGVIPLNKENVRHRIINPKWVLNESTGKVELNRKYDDKKPTLAQVYDSSQVSESELNQLNEPLKIYEKMTTGNPLQINTYNDSIVNYIFEINNDNLESRYKTLLRYNKKVGEPIKLDSVQGTVFMFQYEDFELDDDPMGGLGLWDANVDLAKAIYTINAYLEKLNMAIVDTDEKNYIVELQRRAMLENLDTACQVARYRAKLAIDTFTLYTARMLGKAKSLSDIQALVDHKLLPKDLIKNANEEVIENISKRLYIPLSQKTKLDKNNTTIKALMELPMESLEFGNSVTEFMTRPFFSPKGKNNVGLTRFELMQKNDPHLVEPYALNYLKVNQLFKNQIKDFAHNVIEKVNETSEEKLLTETGDYTMYGEYVIELVGQDIARYAFLKSLTGKGLEAKVVGQDIIYDTPKNRSLTTLQALGINSTDPEEIAETLHSLMEKGLNKLDADDTNFVAKAVSNAIEGTNLTSFSLAEGLIRHSGFSMGFRFDAMKDVGDMDSCRSIDDDTRKSLLKVFDVMQQVVSSINGVSPHSHTFAEVTDIDSLYRSTMGEKTNPYHELPEIKSPLKTTPDIMSKLFSKTGIATEAAYSITFTDILRIFSKDFEEGYDGGIGNIHSKLNDFMNKPLEYTRNALTFADNHDKPSVIHGMALDLDIFLSTLTNQASTGDSGKDAHISNRNRYARKYAMEILTNSYDDKSMPIEARLNIDNPRYFHGVSAKAIAVAKLYRDIINEDLNGIANDTEKALLKEAITCIVNANFKGQGSNVNMCTINIPELSSIEKAFGALLANAGVNLDSNDFYAVVNKANQYDMVQKYLVKSEHDSGRISHLIKEDMGLFDATKNPEDLDLYVVSLAALILASYAGVKGANSEDYLKLKRSITEFIEKYDFKEVAKNRSELPSHDSPKIATEKDGFGTKDFEVTIRMVIEQAKYLASQREDLKDVSLFSKSDDILVKMFRSATEPAFQKTLMYLAFLQALPGIPTIFVRDALCGLGFEEKTKNIHLQNRNAIVWSQLKEGPLKPYREYLFREVKKITNIRNIKGAEALNDGAPYKAYTSNGDIPGVFRQDGKGNMAISLFNAIGINTGSRWRYGCNNSPDSLNTTNPYIYVPSEQHLDYIRLQENIFLPDGTEFTNLFDSDNNKYVSKNFNGACYIIRQGAELAMHEGRVFLQNGAKIVFNKDSGRKGVMILKHLNPAFKGSHDNKSFNHIADNYKLKESNNQGEKLSILAR